MSVDLIFNLSFNFGLGFRIRFYNLFLRLFCFTEFLGVGWDVVRNEFKYLHL